MVQIVFSPEQREYIKKGFLDACGKMPDFWVILNSNAYYEKGVLTWDDIEEINAKIEAQHVAQEETEE